MADPFQNPATGSLPKLYRMLRDNAYYVAGTILCLTPDQVNPLHHEEVNVDAHDSEERRNLLTSLQDVVQVLNQRVIDLEARAKETDELLSEAALGIDALTKRIAALEAADVPVEPPPPAPPPEPPPDVLTEPVSQEPHIEA